ncbi:hypothetical protein [Parafilimonas sp.]|uniref:hypothetical protein n=1 Tax=Parafilimonas sp. TaxID=1969739 RepID=UPI0039E63792
MAESLNISDVRLYNLHKNKFGEKEAEEFVSLIKDEVNNSFDAKKDILATKEDIAKLELKIAQTETKMILWAFVFWVTQLGAVFAFLKFIPH